ncbi:MAG: cupin domain-containing protein [Acetobacteraceae bacterium]|nr:cupin domain-containing protein [Acetobacteraceae bacterium]
MTAVIDAQGFRAGLLRDGYTAAESSRPAGPASEPHAHEFHAKAMVLEGSFTLTVGGTAATYRPGEVFTMPAGTEHIEQPGPQGVRYIGGRKLTR